MTTNILETCRDIWRDDYIAILNRLEIINPAFRFITHTLPHFDNVCNTACVTFNRDSNFCALHISPEFWLSTPSLEFKAFIISHEAMHVFFNHGKRMKDLENQQLANIAEDIVINEFLYENFFNRLDIDPNNKYCSYKMLSHLEYERGREFEYYYHLLLENADSIDLGSASLIGSHSSGDREADHDEMGIGVKADDFTEKDIQAIREQLKELGIDLDEHMDALPTMPGTNSGGGRKTVSVKVVKKKKWETVIKQWANFNIKKVDREVSHWVGKDRRMQLIGGNMIIPSTVEACNNKNEKNKITVWFFQDTSGSCVHLAERFFAAANSLPEKYFDIKMFCFDTEVYPTTLKSGELYGFGGTCFRVIEEYIVKNTVHGKQNTKYPDAIFVITDGYGTNVNPLKPKNWHWFLSENYTECIPTGCSVHKLSNYE